MHLLPQLVSWRVKQKWDHKSYIVLPSIMLSYIVVQDTSTGGGKVKHTEPSYQGRMMLTKTAEPSDEAIILPTSSVDITDVSRMGFDLRRKAVVGDRNKVDPDKADKRFVELLLKLLEKVCAASF